MVEHFFSPRGVCNFLAVGSFVIGTWSLGSGSVDALEQALWQRPMVAVASETTPPANDYAFARMGIGTLLIANGTLITGLIANEPRKPD